MFFQNYLLHLLKNVNQTMLIGLGGFFIGAGKFLTQFANGISLLVFYCIIWSLGEILFFSNSQVLAFNLAKRKGTQMGTYQMIYAFTHVLGPVCGGFIYHHY